MTSSGSLDTSANSNYPASSPFSFSSSTNNNNNNSSSFFMSTSFSDLLNSPSTADVNRTVSRGLADRIAERTGSGVPKFKSIPPPSLPISPPSVSPSSYFSIPPGLSPAELLDSPVLLSSANEQQPWSYQEPTKKDEISMVKSEFSPMQQSFSPEISTI